jgi:CRP-like cAMP-binding protein
MYFLYPDERIVDRIIEYFEPRVYTSNEVVWKQGSASTCAILVMEGLVMSELEDEAGTKTVMGVGYLLGEYGLVNNRVSPDSTSQHITAHTSTSSHALHTRIMLYTKLIAQHASDLHDSLDLHLTLQPRFSTLRAHPQCKTLILRREVYARMEETEPELAYALARICMGYLEYRVQHVANRIWCDNRSERNKTSHPLYFKQTSLCSMYQCLLSSCF